MELTPQFVLIEDDYINVSAFKHLKPKERPKVYCPKCKDSVILKLGETNRPHFSHREGSACSWSPESILHFESKLKLAEDLRQANSIRPTGRCSRCSNYRLPTDDFITGWNRVEVEFTFGNYRADIALLQNDTLVAIIEVFVTHEVSPEKAGFLNLSKIPWLELAVSKRLKPWSVRKNDVLIRSSQIGNLEMKNDICQICQSQIDNNLHQMKLKASKGSQKSINGFTFVDVFYAHSGYLRFPIWTVTSYAPYRTSIVWEHGIIERINGSVSNDKVMTVINEFIETRDMVHKIRSEGGQVILNKGIEVCPSQYDMFNILEDIAPAQYMWLDGIWVLNPFLESDISDVEL